MLGFLTFTGILTVCLLVVVSDIDARGGGRLHGKGHRVKYGQANQEPAPPPPEVPVAAAHRADPPDPCLDAINIGSASRSQLFVPSEDDPILCDSSLNENAWYRFDGFETGSRMPEACVNRTYICGTHSPIWMNGKHPTELDGEPIEVDVCARTTDAECCGWSAKIKVKLCPKFFSYQLKRVGHCESAYCFGDTYPCNNTGHHWDTISQECIPSPYPNMTKPMLSKPYISHTKIVKNTIGERVNATVFSINCEVGYERQVVDDGARFDVNFQTDDGEMVNSPVTLSSTSDLVYTINERALVGRIGKTLLCRVVSYFEKTSTAKSLPVFSTGFWFGIYPVSEQYDFSASSIIPYVRLLEEQVLTFRMESSFPLTQRHCYDNPDSPCYRPFTFRVNPSKSDYKSTSCDFTLIPDRKVQRNQLTIAPIKTVGIRQSPFIAHIQFDRVSTPKMPTIFEGYRIQPIVLEIQDRFNRPSCESTGDPHIIPFGSRTVYHILHVVSDFYLLKLKVPTRTLEVQVRHSTVCSGGRVVCNCGVIAREGNNILGINACRSGPPILVRYLTSPATNNEQRGVIAPTGANKWDIILPSDIRISVNYLGSSRIDLYVTGLNEDYIGVCGQHTNENNWNQFRVAEADSFFHLSSNNLPKCVNEPTDVPVCSCSGKNEVKLCGSLNTGAKEAKTTFANICGEKANEQENPGRRRRRRSPAEDEDIIMDDDFFYTPMTPQDLPKVTLTWPTQVGRITEEQATAECYRSMRSSPAYATCAAKFVNITNLLTNCVLDIQIVDSLSASEGYSKVVESGCIYTIQAGIEDVSVNDTSESDSVTSSPHTTTTAKSELENILNFVMDNVQCPSDCSRHGSCVRGFCTCESDYIGDDCSMAADSPLVIQEVSPRYAGIRALHNGQLAATVMVSAFGLDLLGRNLDCRVTLVSVVSGRVACHVTLESEKDMATTGLFSVNVSISNDKKRYSSEETVFIYDSHCMACNNDGKCNVKVGWVCPVDDNDKCISMAQNQGCEVLRPRDKQREMSSGLIILVLLIVLVIIGLLVFIFWWIKRKRCAENNGGKVNEPLMSTADASKVSTSKVDDAVRYVSSPQQNKNVTEVEYEDVGSGAAAVCEYVDKDQNQGAPVYDNVENKVDASAAVYANDA